jgi:capsid protein
MEEFQTIETLVGKDTKLVEVELMLTPKELQTFAAYCIKNEIKFNDWIRKLAYDNLQKSKES